MNLNFGNFNGERTGDILIRQTSADDITELPAYEGFLKRQAINIFSFYCKFENFLKRQALHIFRFNFKFENLNW